MCVGIVAVDPATELVLQQNAAQIAALQVANNLHKQELGLLKKQYQQVLQESKVQQQSHEADVKSFSDRIESLIVLLRMSLCEFPI